MLPSLNHFGYNERTMRETNARYRRRRPFAVAAVLAVIVAFPGCGLFDTFSPSDKCDDGFVTDRFVLVGSEMVTAPYPNNAYRDGGQAHFDWHHDVFGLCVESPEDDNVAKFSVLGSEALLNLLPTGEGRVYHAPGIQAYTGQLTPLVTSQVLLRGEVRNIGLRQGNPNGSPATISVELHLSMVSSGDLSFDIVRLKDLISSLEIATTYRRAK